MTRATDKRKNERTARRKKRNQGNGELKRGEEFETRGRGREEEQRVGGSVSQPEGGETRRDPREEREKKMPVRFPGRERCHSKTGQHQHQQASIGLQRAKRKQFQDKQARGGGGFSQPG
jgi:hypothetical protein